MILTAAPLVTQVAPADLCIPLLSWTCESAALHLQGRLQILDVQILHPLEGPGDQLLHPVVGHPEEVEAAAVTFDSIRAVTADTVVLSSCDSQVL